MVRSPALETRRTAGRLPAPVDASRRRAPQPMRKPDNLVYGVDDLPPPRVAVFVALQQLAFLTALLGVPGLAIANLGGNDETFLHLAGATLLAAALAVVLQGIGRFGFGAGLFYPLQCTTAAFPALLFASHEGLDLAESFSMVAVAGLTQVLFSFVIVRLRGIFTVEVAGLAIFLIGVGLGQQGLILIIDAPVEPHMAHMHYVIAGVTLATLVVLHIYVRSRLRLFTTLIGLSVGFAASAALGLLDPRDVAIFDAAPLIGFPQLPVFGWGFDADAIIPFAVTGFVFALTSIGVQTIAQRNNDVDWKSPDLVSISRGVRAEGLVHLLGSAMNTLPMVASGGAVMLAAASGCTSRALAFWTGGFLALAAVLPKVIGFWLMLPAGVTGALFLFLSAFATVSGLQLVGSRMLDGRKVLAIGIGFVTAIAYEPIRALLDARLPELRPVTFSAFAVSVLVAVGLLALFRIGAAQRVVRRFDAASASHDGVARFLEAEGRRWGARHDVVQRGAHVAWQAIELLGDGLVDPAHPDIEVETRYDDLFFEVIVRYTGTLPELSSAPPSAEALVDDPTLARSLAGFLIQRLAPVLVTRSVRGAHELHFRLPL
jgi:xanthine permease XanP